MAVSAQARSRAAAISALIKRDSGYNVESSASRRPTGVRIRCNGTSEYATINIYDPYDGTTGVEQAQRFVAQRSECIQRDLTKRGYTFYLSGVTEVSCRIHVTGRDKPARKKAAPKVHTAKISFEIDPAAAVKYLGWSFEKKYTEAELALAVGDAISEMIEVSNAHNLGAIRIVKNEFVR